MVAASVYVKIRLMSHYRQVFSFFFCGITVKWLVEIAWRETGGKCVTSKNEIADNQFLDLVDLRKMTTLDSGAERPGLISQPRRCRVAVSGKLFAPIVPLFTKQRNW